MRPSDNRFYWLTGEELHDRYSNDSRSWSTRLGAATLQARIKDNDIQIYARGFKRVTIWLGQGMLDFEKPTRIMLNQLNCGSRKIMPNLETLLEIHDLDQAEVGRPNLAARVRDRMDFAPGQEPSYLNEMPSRTR